MFDLIFCIITLSVSVFYACIAVRFYWPADKKPMLTEKIRKALAHLSGALVGFAILYYLIRKARFCIINNQYTIVSFADIVLLFIAAMGVAGYLATAIWKISDKLEHILLNQKNKS